ncbi:hypothetical protein [Demequina salsinemoris]|uniref:hypothetical protein n=1 Tax=Demequina salsinemoris TaxID=577470 RepID=UPI000784A630|nr:hypothetical protein [Demequina salsinemoris]
MTDEQPQDPDVVGSSDDITRRSNESIRQIERLAKQVEKSKNLARTAKTEALEAGKVKTGWGPFANRESIDELQKSGTAQARAIGELADTQTQLFELQQRLARTVTEYMKLALASKASAQSVYRQLEAKLSGADSATLSELAKQELLLVMDQARQMLDLSEQQEQIEFRLNSGEHRIAELIHSSKHLQSLTDAAAERLDDAEARLAEGADDQRATRAVLDKLALHVDDVAREHEVSLNDAVESLRVEQHAAIDRLSAGLRRQEEAATQARQELEGQLASQFADLDAADSASQERAQSLSGEVVALQRRNRLLTAAIVASSAVGIAGLVVALLT